MADATRGEGPRSRAFAIGAVLATLAIAAVAVIVFTSSGDDAPPASPQEAAEAEIRDSIEVGRQAALDGDAEAFCSYLSEGVIDTLEVNGDLNGEIPTCADLVEANSASVAEVAATAPEVTDIAVTGGTARVTAELGGTGSKRFVELGEPVVVGFTEEDGTWKLDELPEAG